MGWLPQRAGSPSLNGGGTAISPENINSSSSQDNNKRRVTQQHPVQRVHTGKYRTVDKLKTRNRLEPRKSNETEKEKQTLIQSPLMTVRKQGWLILQRS